MSGTAYKDYLVSQFRDGPWTAVFGYSTDDALAQFAMAEGLAAGAVVYVGLPAPTPDVWTAERLSREIAQSLEVEPISGLDIDSLSVEIAQDANERVARFAAQRAADLGRVVGVVRNQVQPHMAAPVFA